MTVNGALLCTNTVGMTFLVGTLHLWYLWAAVLVGALATPVSFFAQRLITYRVHVGSRVVGL